MINRPRQKKPVTAERVDNALDILAWVISKAGSDANLLAPIWKRLEAERERLVEEEAILNAARDRLKRSKDRMATQSA
ncbi:hypothetical protein [Pelagibacterium limicola]|uniref:hypothetical protein n=1 Tax=Pelagibacterium limicola TaxID=2791022 RepID=UPI0018AF86C4|nr:hypothetical protein [Pelagibacterium limicola]